MEHPRPLPSAPEGVANPSLAAEHGAQSRLHALQSDWRVPALVAAGGYGLWRFTMNALKRGPGPIRAIAEKIDGTVSDTAKLALKLPLALPVIPLPGGNTTPLEVAKAISPRRILNEIDTTGRAPRLTLGPTPGEPPSRA